MFPFLPSGTSYNTSVPGFGAEAPSRNRFAVRARRERYMTWVVTVPVKFDRGKAGTVEIMSLQALEKN